jgi:hypothetical protein
MESSMHHVKRAGVRVLVLALTAAVALVVTGAASAEFPTLRSGPSVAGVPQEGQTLTGSKGQWLMADGLACNDCQYRWTWQRCNADISGCTDIPGATEFSYTLGADDVGKRIRLVEWNFKRDCGEWNYSTGTQECADITKNSASFPTDIVTPKPVTTAQSTAPPTIAGLPMEEEVLRATGGTWTGPGTITKTIYWQRCNGVGEACATIVGATGPTYKLTSADVGGRIRVIETATNEGGAAQAVSTPTAVVVELRPTATRPTIAAAKVGLPHRLLLDQVKTTQAGTRVTVKIRVSDDRGFRVTGVLVKATPTALLSGSTRERASDATGWATFTFTATGKGTSFVYAEARRKGEKAQTGVSTANLFRIKVR